jgi:hypothetical protein
MKQTAKLRIYITPLPKYLSSFLVSSASCQFDKEEFDTPECSVGALMKPRELHLFRQANERVSDEVAES